MSFKAVDTPRQRLRLDTGLGYLYEARPEDAHFDSATLSVGAKYKADLTKTAKFSFQPRYLLTMADAGAYKSDQEAALTAALASAFALKVSYTNPVFGAPARWFRNHRHHCGGIARRETTETQIDLGVPRCWSVVQDEGIRDSPAGSPVESMGGRGGRVV